MAAYPFVSITWYDAQDAKDNWVRLDEDFTKWTKEPCRVTSHGFLIAKTRLYFVLAADICADGIVGRVTKIPRPWVLKFTRSRTVRPAAGNRARSQRG